MNKHCTKKVTRKILSLALCLIMTAGTFEGVFPAAEAAGEEKAAPVPLITCASAGIELENNDSSVETSLCLNLDDERIISRIHREDVVLGGVFEGMFVSGIRHDKKTILLDLVGVPDFGKENDSAGLQGTMTFPGENFGCEDSVITSVDIIEKTGTKEEWKPSFIPHLNAMHDSGDEIEMSIVLIPVVGAFSEDFGIEDISLARNLKNGRVNAFEEMEEGCRELIVDVPKTGWRKDGDGYSVLGSIILSGGSMADADGKLYEKPVYAVREFSLEKPGRDLTQQDVQTIQGIVGGFGNTTTGTVLGLISGGASAGSAAYTMLGWCGVVPTVASRHEEIMKALREINNTVNEVNSKCDYMSGVLDAHTLMINKMGVKLDEQFLGKYDASFAAMVEMMDTLEAAMQSPVIQEKIEAVVDELAEKYQTPQIKVNRDFDDDDLVFDDLSDFYESDDGFATEDAAYADWEEPEILGPEDGSTDEWFEEGAEDLDTLLAMGGFFEEEMPEEDIAEDIEDAFAMADEEIANPDEEEDWLTAEEAQEVVTEAEADLDEELPEEGFAEDGEDAFAMADEEIAGPDEVEDWLTAEEAQVQEEVADVEALVQEAGAEEEAQAQEEVAEEEVQEEAADVVEQVQEELADVEALVQEAGAEEEALVQEEAVEEEALVQEELADVEALVQEAADDVFAQVQEAADVVEQVQEELADVEAQVQEEAVEEETQEEEPIFETEIEAETEVKAEIEETAETEIAEETEEEEAEETEEEEAEETEEEEAEETKKTEAEETEETEADLEEGILGPEVPLLYMTALGDEAEEANLTVGARIGNILRRIWDGFLSLTQSEAEAETEETAETEITDEIEETEETEETEAAAQDRILEGAEMEKFLIELDTEIGKIHLSGNVTIGMMLTKIADRYSDLVHYLDKSDDSNPIEAFCNIHEGVDNFKTSSLKEEMLYEEYLKCQLIRALTLLQSLDSPTMYNVPRENFNNIIWPDVTDGVRDRSGNPYCYLMEGFVRLATVSEVQNWIEPMKNPKAAGYVDSVELTSKSRLHVSESEFFRRMHGRNLLEELELAGITNLDKVKNNDTWSNPDGSRKNFGGITFHYERWGVNNGYRKFKWSSTHARSDGVRYADPYTTSLGDYDGRNWGGEFLGDKNSYMIVAPEYIRWGYGYGDLPAESVLYQGNDKSTYYYYPMTYLVVL